MPSFFPYDPVLDRVVSPAEREGTMPKKRLADMNRSERIRYKELEQQRERRFRRKMAMADTEYRPPAHITLHPVPSLQTPTDTGYLDYREGLKLQRLIERMET